MKAAGDLAGSVGISLRMARSTTATRSLMMKGKAALLAGLEAHIFQERGLGKVTFPNVAGVVNTLPPANKVQQIVSIGAQVVFARRRTYSRSR